MVDHETAGINVLPADLGWHDFGSRYAHTGGAKKKLGVSKSSSLELELVFFFDPSAAMSHACWVVQPQTASLS